MKKATRIVLVALFLQTLVGVHSSNAAVVPLRIISVSASSQQVVVAWTPQKLVGKDIFEVEFAKVSTVNTSKII